MANSEQKNKNVTDLIQNDFKEWKNEFVILDCGTGTGKTHFVLNVLAPYARKNKKSILYLCNRRKLRQDIQKKVDEIPFVTITVMSYQNLQKQINKGEKISKYDYIIADETHYILSDALFNNYTDITYKFLMDQKHNNNVVIFMSATAKSFFNMLLNKKDVLPNRYYYLEKTYEYVKDVFFYNAPALSTMIDDILLNHPKEKILVFCNSANRMFEMHETYKDQADYYCAEDTKNKKLKEICNVSCIVERDKNYITFDKMILFTTKALDNGIDLKDSAIKHIFTEIFDLDSMIQSLGRKRTLNTDFDTCSYYIKNYNKRAITCFYNTINAQLEPVRLLKNNEEEFIKKYGIYRDKLKNNKILYEYWEKEKGSANNRTATNGRVHINDLRYIKYVLDDINVKKMQQIGYVATVCEWLGTELTDKVQVLDITPLERNMFIEYLRSIIGQPLYDNEQTELKAEFIKIGLKDKNMGIHTLNGKLADMKYSFKIFNKDVNGKEYRDYKRKNSDDSINSNYKKRFWMVYEHKWSELNNNPSQEELSQIDPLKIAN